MGKETAWTEAQADIAGTRLHYMRAGRGQPVVVLHHDTGSLTRLPFYDALAEKYEVLVPHHPGYGKSERPDWMRHVRDIAAMYRWLLGTLKIFGYSAYLHPLGRHRLLGLGQV